MDLPLYFVDGLWFFSPSLGWGRSLGQVSSADMDEAPEAKEQSFCKSKGGPKYDQISCQGVYITEVVILILVSLFSIPK